MKKSKVFFLMVAAYITVFVLPLIAGNITFATVRNRLMDEVAKTNLLTLYQSGANIENELNRIQKMGLFVSENSTVRKCLSSGFTNAEERYRVREVIDILDARLDEMTYANDAAMYCVNSQSFVTNSGMASEQLYIDYLAYPIGMTREEILVWLKNFQSYYDIYAVNMFANAQNVPSIIVAQALPTVRGQDKLGVLLVSIPQKAILSMLEEANPNSSYAIVSDAGDILSASDDDVTSIDLSALEGDSGFTRVEAGKETVWLSFVKLQSYGLSVVSTVSEDVWTAPVESSQRVFYLVYGVCIVIGSLMVLFFSKRQYSPINQIVTNLQQLGIEHPSKNEYRYIHHSINSILQQNAVLTQRIEELDTEREQFISLIERSRTQIQSSIVLGLTHGMVENQEERLALMHSYGISFTKEWFMTVVVDTTRAASHQEIILDRIRQQIQQAFSDRMELGVSMFRGMPLLVLNADSKEELHAVVSLMEEAATKLGRQYHTELPIAPGKAHAGLSGISQSFQEAEKSLRDTAAWRRGSQRQDAGPLSGMVEQMNELISQQKSAQSIAAFRRFLNETSAMPMEQSHLIVSVARMMIRQLEDSADDQEEPSELIDAWRRLALTDGESQSAMVRSALDLLQKSMQTVASDREKAKSGAEQAERIRLFIEEHLTNPMLSQNMIAEHFQISQSYLSHLFKREFQIGMNDYINHARVVRSLPYLMDPSLSIADVAEKIGFSSSHTLIRVFKKYENMTPGRYRSMNEVGSDDQDK